MFIKNYIKYYLTRLVRNYPFQFTLFLFTAYIIYTYLIFTEKDFYFPTSVLNLSSFITQIGMFIFGFFGIQLTREELMKDIYLSNRTYLHKIIAKLSFSILLILILSAVYLLLYWIFIFFNKVPISYFYINCTLYILLYWIFIFFNKVPISYFYINCTLYILFYWTIPFIISFLLGVILALLIKNTFSYFLLIIIAGILGPLNLELFPYSWINQFNLAQRESHNFYHPLYGFLMEESVKYRQIAFLFLITFIFFLSHLTLAIKKSFKKIILIISPFLVLFTLSYSNYIYLFKHEQRLIYDTNNPSITSDIKFYKKNQEKTSYLNIQRSNVKLKDYQIIIDTREFYT